MVRTVYQNGDIFFAEDANALAYPVPDGQDLIGHGPKVIDDYLADEDIYIKSKFYKFYDRLKVSYNTGLSFSYLGGLILLNNGSLISINSGNISVPNNVTSYIFVGSNGSVQTSTQLPNESFPLALVTTSGGSLAGNVIDLRNKLVDRITPATIPVQQLIPSGVGMDFWGTSLPSGWLWADGSFYDPSTYPTLFAAIGYSFGQSGSQFRVPDKRGRVSVGAGQGSGLTNRTLGQTFGEENVTLNTSQMPSHSHGVNDPNHSHGVNDPVHGHGVYDPGHGHTIFALLRDPPYNSSQTDGFQAKPGVGIAGEDAGPIGYIATNLSGNYLVGNNGTGIGVYPNGTGISLYGASTGISLNSQGGNGSHNNIQPSLVANHIIKI